MNPLSTAPHPPSRAAEHRPITTTVDEEVKARRRMLSPDHPEIPRAIEIPCSVDEEIKRERAAKSNRSSKSRKKLTQLSPIMIAHVNRLPTWKKVALLPELGRHQDKFWGEAMKASITELHARLTTGTPEKVEETHLCMLEQSIYNAYVTTMRIDAEISVHLGANGIAEGLDRVERLTNLAERYQRRVESAMRLRQQITNPGTLNVKNLTVQAAATNQQLNVNMQPKPSPLTKRPPVPEDDWGAAL